ncbi:hypothetical protein J4459_03905 [Candidatus Woesearchaeota archaeon]|nr:hypothetical protein [Candidatus Woesearchaeota archaeon]HLD38248.1 hypothetical protein [Candidatus Nanoarchaeia archaeon]
MSLKYLLVRLFQRKHIRTLRNAGFPISETNLIGWVPWKYNKRLTILLVENWGVTEELLAKLNSNEAKNFLKYGLIGVEKLINTKEDLKIMGNNLIILSKNFKSKNFYYMFLFAFYEVRKFVKTPEDLLKIGKILSDIVGSDNDEDFYFPLFAFGFSEFKYLIKTPEDLLTVGKNFVVLSSLVNFERENIDDLFERDLPSIKYLIKTKKDLQKITAILLRIYKKDKQIYKLYSNTRQFKDKIKTQLGK